MEYIRTEEAPWNNKRLKAPALLLSVVTLIGVSISATAQTIKNGSFESPVIPDGTFDRVSPTSWNGGAALINPSASGSIIGSVETWPQPVDGQQYADIGQLNSNPLSQTFTLASTGEYVIEWQDNASLFASPAPYSVTLAHDSSQVLFTAEFDAKHADDNWQNRRVTLSLLSGSYELIFTPLSNPGANDSLIDVVSISAVPEVGSASLLALGVCGVLGHVQRRRRIEASVQGHERAKS